MQNRDIFFIFFNIAVCCYRGGSNEFKQHTIFNIKKKISLKYSKSAAMGFFQGTQEQVRNSHGR